MSITTRRRWADSPQALIWAHSSSEAQAQYEGRGRLVHKLPAIAGIHEGKRQSEVVKSVVRLGRDKTESLTAAADGKVHVFGTRQLARGYKFMSDKKNWQARWIWHGKERTPFHFHLFIRKSFTLPEKVKSATVHVTATDKYKLYLNGHYLGRGPARCDSKWQPYDSYDVAGLVRIGPNALAVQAYHYGITTGFTTQGVAGFKGQIEIDTDEEQLVIGSGADWLVKPGEGWRRDAKKMNSQVGVTEVYDGRLDDPNWMSSEFDDSRWESATVISHRKGPWSVPEPRDIPMLREEEVRPERG